MINIYYSIVFTIATTVSVVGQSLSALLIPRMLHLRNSTVNRTITKTGALHTSQCRTTSMGSVGGGEDLSTMNKLFTYKLGNSLYIPLTSESNSNSLPFIRGPRFLRTLPNDVLTSLILVRLAEEKKHDSPEELAMAVEDNSLDQVLSSFFNSTYTTASISRSSGISVNGHSSDLCFLKQQIRNMLSKKSLSFSSSSKDCYDHEENPRIDTLYNEIIYNLSPFQINEKVDTNGSSATRTSTHNNDENHIRSIVFAGEGEPTLRLNAICTISSLIQNATRSQIPIRVLTNGLAYYSMHYKKHHGHSDRSNNVTTDGVLEPDILQQMKDAGVTALSVTLPTSCPKQYIQLMKPLKHFRHDGTYESDMEEELDDAIKLAAHESVCKFIRDAVQLKFDVEVTGVNHDFVDKEKTEQLAVNLGVIKPFRWRSYF